MKCQSCGKKEATVRYYENINGAKQELHFCNECAQKLGFNGFSDMFSPIFSMMPKLFIEETKQKKCDKCGYTFDKYLNTGFFGCPKCYEAFNEDLDELFIKLQGKTRHIEKENKLKVKKIEKENISKDKEIQKLKIELNKLVENEEYEKAAILRDKIKSMEKK